MDENILEKIKIRLLNGIEINDSDFNFMKLNANLFKGIKFIKKRKAKKNGKCWNLESRNNNNIACGKSLFRNKRKIGRTFKSFSNKSYSCKKTITSTEWVDTCFVKAVRRWDRIHLDRD